MGLNFKRPFLATYIKLCMLITYFAPCFYKYRTAVLFKCNFNYKESSAAEEESSVDESLAIKIREVRHMPLVLAEEAKQARIPYSFNIIITLQWISCTLSYQLSLFFGSVSSVYLIFASSPLFMVILSPLFMPSSAGRITLTKLLLFFCNLIGIGLASHYLIPLQGTCFALSSAILYALYFVCMSYHQHAGYDLDVNFIFDDRSRKVAGSIGLLTMIFYTPFLLILHYSSVESLFPLPNQLQSILLLLNGFLEVLFINILWLYGTALRSTMADIIAVFICVPISLLSDTLLQNQPLTLAQFITALPVLFSLIGAAFQNVKDEFESNDLMHNELILEEAQNLIEDSSDDNGHL
ncbi:unnamed protein product [Thelazia callipaeda]|uniref:EamA domain-containing protein n=1 Tax=Thelazia callipaeda TaxID=103827 RepID=A0A0N5D4E1_THECL|nr:unnamed protein product [Thelazia callipaeda]